MVDGFGSDGDGALAIPPLAVIQGPMQKIPQIVGVECLQPEQARPADEGFVDFEVGVFRGRPNQGEGSVLNPWQQRILLGAVEPVHFIDEQDGAQAMTVQSQPGCIHLSAEIFDAGKHRVQAAEVGPGVVGDDPRQRRFANARRAMQQQIAYAVSRNRSPQ